MKCIKIEAGCYQYDYCGMTLILRKHTAIWAFDSTPADCILDSVYATKREAEQDMADKEERILAGEKMPGMEYLKRINTPPIILVKPERVICGVSELLEEVANMCWRCKKDYNHEALDSCPYCSAAAQPF
jgi:hypothetical protein